MKILSKRLLSLLLAIVLVFGLAPSVMAATDDSPATDPDTVTEPETTLVSDLPPAIKVDDKDNPYPYGVPVDTFYPEELLAPDPYGIALLAQDNIPDEMWDNTILRALEYTGVGVQTLKDNNWLYTAQYISGQLKLNAPSLLSGIPYWEGVGACPNGNETVSASGTATGLAPNIAYFKSNGLVCASFVTYYLLNYLPNIEGVDVSTIANAANSNSAYWGLASVLLWSNTLNQLAGQSGSGVTKYTSASTAYQNLVPGDVIVFQSLNDGSLNHVGIYAGEYDLISNGTSRGTYHFLIHVGNSRGPEITTVEYMADAGFKSCTPVVWYHLDIHDQPENGYIQIYKKDTSGSALSGAVFTAVNRSTGASFKIGPTNASGYAKSGELPLGTYKVTETTFPNGYEASGQSSWTVTISSNTPNLTVTVNAVNKLSTGAIRVVKKTTTGKGVEQGWKVNLLREENGSWVIISSGTTKKSTSDPSYTFTGLAPGRYIVQEDPTDGKDGYALDTQSYYVDVVVNQTAEVTVTNQVLGELKIIKAMPDGGSVSGWKFNLSRASDGVSMGTFTTGSDGTITTGYLLPGEYMISEIIPDDSVYYCESANPQTVTIIDGETTEVRFTNRIRPGQIRIEKVDLDGNLKSGARFLLEWSEDGSNWSPVTYRNSQYVSKGTCNTAGLTDGQLETDADCVITFTGLYPTLQYRVTETEAPEGLQLLTSPAYIGGLSVEDDYTVSLRVVNCPNFTLPATGGDGFIWTQLALIFSCCFGFCTAMYLYLKKQDLN